MTRGGLLVAWLLAGLVLSCTGPATEPELPAGPADPEGSFVESEGFDIREPDSVGDPDGAEQQAEEIDRSDEVVDVTEPQVSEFNVDEFAAQVQDQMDVMLAVKRRGLEAVEAAHDSARANAAYVFTRLDYLEQLIGMQEVKGAATQLSRLRGEAAQLSSDSQELLAGLNEARKGLMAFQQSAVETLDDARRDARKLAVAQAVEGEELDEDEVASTQTLLRTELWTLDAEVKELQGSVEVSSLESRSDLLVNRAALLVARLEEAGVRVQAMAGKGGAAGSATGAGVAADRPQGGSGGAEPTASASTRPVAAGQGSTDASGGVSGVDEDAIDAGEIAEVITNRGVLLIQFFPDTAPRHVENFKQLAQDGFYNGLVFHRVLPGFIAQGGCPLGSGLGGPGYQIDAEFNDRPHRRGTVSMARFAHPDSAGSQFFICLADRPELDGKQTVFGRIISGDATLQEIESLGSVDGVPRDRIEIVSVKLRPWKRGDNEKTMTRGNPLR